METVSDHLELPPGWIMQKSKTYPDRVYYFNTLTGVSSWAFPGAACSDSDEKAVSTGKNKSKPISSKKLRTPEKHETKVLDLRTRQNSNEKQQQKDILLAADSKSHTSTVVGRLKMAKKSSKLLLENCTREQNKTQMWSTGCPKLTNTEKDRTCERVAKEDISHTLAGDEGSLEQNKLGHLAVPVATDFRKTVDSSLSRISSDRHLRTEHLSAVSRAVTQGADVLSGSAVSVPTSELEPSYPVALAMEVEYDEDDNDVVIDGLFVYLFYATFSDQIQEIQEHIRMLNPAVNQVMGMLTETVQKASTLQTPSPLTPHPDNRATFIIIDTNVLIQSLGFVKNLRDLTVKEWGQQHLVIPWVVLQELDSLKENKYKMALGESVQAKAREAVRYLHSCLISAHPRVTGQTPADAYQVCQGSGFVMVNNDDRIINCCLQYQQKYPQSAVQLLTEDKNLQNKAMVIGLHCSNVKTLHCKLKDNKAFKVIDIGELISVPKSAFILDNAEQHAKNSEVLEEKANAAKTAMDRFEAVWSTINNGCSMAEEKVKGQLTPEEKTAFRETILNFIPLLKQLYSQFDQ
ncbi:hypothetical protein C0Q70_17894 [Pomacea canaliculata]|uniref:WW domain-containing protein n=1 Tax=Pomacea canaliculata TaxID=400727 RepID=A0A2T7NLQ0_POMCA|nr:hypothetical protein C0Q70_17894 [Pomacea canaliculata]